jgi:hypothetical protein
VPRGAAQGRPGPDRAHPRRGAGGLRASPAGGLRRRGSGGQAPAPERAALWKTWLPLAEALNKQTPALTRALKDLDRATALAAHQALEAVATARRQPRLWADALPPLPAEKGKKGAFEDPLPRAPEAAAALAGSLGDKSVEVRLVALYALETLGPDAAPAAPALGDRDPFVRWGAARALGKMAPHGAAKGVPALAAVLACSSSWPRCSAWCSATCSPRR